MRRPLRFLFENSLFLIGGALAALLWANLDAEGYHRFVHLDLSGGAVPAGEAHGEVTVHFLVNDLLMALFFGIAAKEVWEALLPGGALSNVRTAATPLLATLGGMVMPAVLYLAVVAATGAWELKRGWPIPMATDIAFSYLVARLVFGPGHPAIPFLLLVAIADDAGGLVVIALFLPKKPVVLGWLALTAVAVALGFVLRRLRLKSFWWYLLGPGVLSWFSFHQAGVHPALGLVPVIPTMPHAHTDLGIFVREELGRRDTLNAFEHWWKNPVELILGLFGLVNAGVALANMGTGTAAVLLGLVAGKPLGIALFVWIGQRAMGLRVPEGMNMRHVIVLGIVAGIGFTVALFVCTAAFPPERHAEALVDSVKMGALLSFGAALLSLVAAWTFRIERQRAAGRAAPEPAKRAPSRR